MVFRGVQLQCFSATVFSIECSLSDRKSLMASQMERGKLLVAEKDKREVNMNDYKNTTNRDSEDTISIGDWRCPTRHFS